MMGTYDDLVKNAAKRAQTQARHDQPLTHLERRELGYKRFNVLLPPTLHRAFKFACIRDGVDMADVAEALIEAYVEQLPASRVV